MLFTVSQKINLPQFEVAKYVETTILGIGDALTIVHPEGDSFTLSIEDGKNTIEEASLNVTIEISYKEDHVMTYSATVLSDYNHISLKDLLRELDYVIKTNLIIDWRIAAIKLVESNF